MAKVQSKRNFVGSYGFVYQTLGEKLVYVERDIKQFALFGMTAEKVAEIKALHEAFRNILTDKELVGLQINATQTKNDTRNDVIAIIRGLYTRAGLAFGKKSAQYKGLGDKNVAQMNDINLYTAAQIVMRFTVENKTELQSTGITDDIIADYTAKIEQFRETVYNSKDAPANRDMATQNRVAKANELYTTLTDVCSIGRTIWKNEGDRAKANDYKIAYKPPKRKKKVSVPAQPATETPDTTQKPAPEQNELNVDTKNA